MVNNGRRASDRDDEDSVNDNGGKFTLERAISTIMITLLAAIIMWAGHTITQATQDIAVLKAQIDIMKMEISDLKKDSRDRDNRDRDRDRGRRSSND